MNLNRPLLILLVASVFLTGCFGLFKPARAVSRTFVLTAMDRASVAGKRQATNAWAIGVGTVKMPDYLLRNQMAVRKSSNEIAYFESALWAERLDNGLQRVLAENLAVLLPSDQIHLSLWRSTDVSREVYIIVREFEVDEHGTGVLNAQWQIQSPRQGETHRAGIAYFSQQGAGVPVNPQQAAAVLSKLAADLSRQLAQALKADSEP